MLFLALFAAVALSLQIPLFAPDEIATVTSGYFVSIKKPKHNNSAQYSVLSISSITSKNAFHYSSSDAAYQAEILLPKAGGLDMNYLSKFKNVPPEKTTNRKSSTTIIDTKNSMVYSIFGIGDQTSCTKVHINPGKQDLADQETSNATMFGYLGERMVKIKVAPRSNDYFIEKFSISGGCDIEETHQLTDAFDGTYAGVFHICDDAEYESRGLTVYEQVSQVPLEQVKNKFTLPPEMLDECIEV